MTRWFAFAVVDGTAYRILGDGDHPGLLVANQTAVEFTPTRTTFNLTTGIMSFSVSFISPIEVSFIFRKPSDSNGMYSPQT